MYFKTFAVQKNKYIGRKIVKIECLSEEMQTAVKKLSLSLIVNHEIPTATKEKKIVYSVNMQNRSRIG